MVTSVIGTVRKPADTTYDGPVAVAGEGKHRVSYRAFDKAGNESATNSVKIQIP
jgi:hypothetical protein